MEGRKTKNNKSKRSPGFIFPFGIVWARCRGEVLGWLGRGLDEVWGRGVDKCPEGQQAWLNNVRIRSVNSGEGRLFRCVIDEKKDADDNVRFRSSAEGHP